MIIVFSAIIIMGCFLYLTILMYKNFKDLL